MTLVNHNFNNFPFTTNPFMASFNQDVLFFSTLSNSNMQGLFLGMNSLGSNPFGALTSFNSFPMQMPAFNFQMPTFNFPAFNFNYNFSNPSQLRQTAVSLTGKRAQDAVRLAESQIGVREDGNSNNGGDVNKYRNGRASGRAWCAAFVSWCYGQGQNNNNASTFGFDESSQSIRKKAQNAGFYQSAQSNYVPQVGDVAVWDYGNGKGHVGIISKVNPDGSFETIEGNCDNRVQRVHRTRNSANFSGFVQMNEWIAANESGSRTSLVA